MPRSAAAIILASLLVASSARASVYTFTFDRALPAPAANCFALGLDEATGALWVRSQADGKAYRLDRQTGSVLQEFPIDPLVTDIDVDGGILYGNAEGEIVRFDAATGVALPSLAQPVTGGNRGLTFVGGELFESGVMIGFPDDARLGHVDAAGTLLGTALAPDLVDSQGIGALDGRICYLVGPPQITPDHAVVLHIVDPATGAQLEQHALFTSNQMHEYYSPEVFGNELYVSVREKREIRVYRITSGTVPALPTTWGSIKDAYLR